MCPQDLRPGVIASLFPSLEKPEGVWNKFVFLVFRYIALHGWKGSLSSLSINALVSGATSINSHIFVLIC